MTTSPTPADSVHRLLRRLRLRAVITGACAVVALLWVAPMVVETVGGIDVANLDHPYLVIATFVILDAVVPLFPSEYLLTAAATLIAVGQTDMNLGLLVLCGAAGAVIGDSLLFLLARSIARP